MMPSKSDRDQKAKSRLAEAAALREEESIARRYLAGRALRELSEAREYFGLSGSGDGPGNWAGEENSDHGQAWLPALRTELESQLGPGFCLDSRASQGQPGNPPREQSNPQAPGLEEEALSFLLGPPRSLGASPDAAPGSQGHAPRGGSPRLPGGVFEFPSLPRPPRAHALGALPCRGLGVMADIFARLLRMAGPQTSAQQRRGFVRRLGLAGGSLAARLLPLANLEPMANIAGNAPALSLGLRVCRATILEAALEAARARNQAQALGGDDCQGQLAADLVFVLALPFVAVAGELDIFNPASGNAMARLIRKSLPQSLQEHGEEPMEQYARRHHFDPAKASLGAMWLAGLQTESEPEFWQTVAAGALMGRGDGALLQGSPGAGREKQTEELSLALALAAGKPPGLDLPEPGQGMSADQAMAQGLIGQEKRSLWDFIAGRMPRADARALLQLVGQVTSAVRQMAEAGGLQRRPGQSFILDGEIVSSPEQAAALVVMDMLQGSSEAMATREFHQAFFEFLPVVERAGINHLFRRGNPGPGLSARQWFAQQALARLFGQGPLPRHGGSRAFDRVNSWALKLYGQMRSSFGPGHRLQQLELVFRKAIEGRIKRQESFALAEARQAVDLLAPAGYQVHGKFGPLFPGLAGKPQTAMDKLIAERTGQVTGAFFRQDLGQIDLVWGKEGSNGQGGLGLAHIMAHDGPEAARDIPRILRHGRVVAPPQGISAQSRCLAVPGEGFGIVLRPSGTGPNERWLLASLAQLAGTGAEGEKVREGAEPGEGREAANSAGELAPGSGVLAEKTNYQVKPPRRNRPQSTGPFTLKGRLMAMAGDPMAPMVLTGEEARRAWSGGSRLLAERRLARRGPASGSGADLQIAHPNWAQIQSQRDIAKALAATARVYANELGPKPRQAIPGSPARALADSLGLTVAELLARKPGQAWNAASILAALNLLTASSAKLLSLAEEVNTDGGVLARFAFQRQLALHRALQAHLLGQAEATGRALVKFNLATKAAGGGVTAMEELLKQVEAGVASRHLARQLLLTGEEGQGALNNYAMKTSVVRSWEAVYETWINALLSKPAEWSTNALAKSLDTAWMIPEKRLASAFGPSPYLSSRRLRAGQALHRAYGLAQGLKDGLQLAGKFLASAEQAPHGGLAPLGWRSAKPFTSLRGPEAGGLDLAGALDLLGSMVRIPGTVLQASDEFFRATAYRMELNAAAFRQAAVEGLDGKEAAERIQRIIDKPPRDLAISAMDAARLQAFISPLHDFSAKARQGTAHNLFSHYPLLRFLVPFLRAPSNLLAFATGRGPLARTVRRFQQEMASDGPQGDLATARLSLGVVLMLLLAVMWAEGRFTGGGPAQPRLRQSWLKSQQPYSIRIGDSWHGYPRSDPLGMLLGIIADCAHLVRDCQAEQYEHEVMRLVGAVGLAFARYCLNRNFLSVLADFVKTTEHPERHGRQWAQRLGGKAAPNGEDPSALAPDPLLREIRKIADQLMELTPGLSKTMAPRRDLSGQFVQGEGGLGPEVMSPIYSQTQKSSPVAEEILRLRISQGIGLPPKSLNGVPLFPDEYSRYLELAGKAHKDDDGLGMWERLGKLIKDKQYHQASDGPEGGKAYLIKEVIHRFREAAKKQISAEFPTLAHAYKEREEGQRRDMGGR